MQVIKSFLKILLLLAFLVSLRLGDHQWRVYAQHHETAYKIMEGIDIATFFMNGGGALGYQNKMKWEYATWRNSPERIWIQKIMFWNGGFIYDASNPPKEYKYPPLFAS